MYIRPVKIKAGNFLHVTRQNGTNPVSIFLNKKLGENVQITLFQILNLLDLFQCTTQNRLEMPKVLQRKRHSFYWPLLSSFYTWDAVDMISEHLVVTNGSFFMPFTYY